MGCANVSEATVAIVEKFGKFEKILGPGLHFYNPFVRSAGGRLSLRLETYDYCIETITSESLSVTIHVGIQFRVDDEQPLECVIVDTDGSVSSERSQKLYRAYYSMSNPVHQMQQHINSYFRTFASQHSLKELQCAQSEMQGALQDILNREMNPFGYRIFRCMVTDIDPPTEVKATMNAVLSSQNKQQAMINEAEGKRQAAILEAQGECEVKRLHGVGLSLQREALADGLQSAMKKLGQEPEALDHNSASTMMLTMSYIDMLGHAAQSGGNSFILSSNPLGAVAIDEQLKASFLSVSQQQLGKK